MEISKSIEIYFDVIHSQLSKEPKSEINAALKVLSGTYDVKDLNSWMKKLVAIVQNDDSLRLPTESSLIASIENANSHVEKDILGEIKKMGS